MEPNKDNILNELLAMGFEETLVKEAIQVSNNKEQALDYIIKTLEEGPKASLPKFKPTVQVVNLGMQNDAKEEDWSDEEQQYKMAFLVRMDLKMGLGKMAAQVGHATIGAYKQLEKRSEIDAEAEHAIFQWNETGQMKIVLKVNTEEELYKLVDDAFKAKINHYVVRDAGRTQIKAGSVTVCAIGPAPASVIDKVTGHLKLL